MPAIGTAPIHEVPAELHAQFERVWALLLREPKEAHDLALQIERAGRIAGDAHAILLGELLSLAVRSRMAHDPAEVADEARRIRAALAALGDEGNAARCIVIEANALADIERRRDAIALIEISLPEARKHLEPPDLGRLLNSYGAIQVDEGSHAQAVTAWYEALEHLSAIPPTPVFAMVTLNIGVMYMRFGNFAAAEPHLREAFDLIQRQGLTGVVNVCAGNLGNNLLQLGRESEACRFLEALAPGVQRDYDLREYVFFQTIRAEALCAVGRLAESRACLEQVEAIGPEGMDLQNKHYLRIAWMRQMRREGLADEALAALRKAEADPMHIEDPGYELQFLLEAAQIMELVGDYRDAYRYARQHHMYAIEMNREFQRADFMSLHTRYEVHKTLVDRDFEVRMRHEAEAAHAEIAELNAQLEARVAEIEALQGSLREQAIRDPLTGVYNRRFLQELLPAELARCARDGSDFCLCLIDADHFKQVNDSFGHLVGDTVLKALGGSLLALEASGIVVARFGGEEFCIVLPNFDRQRAMILLESLRADFSSKPEILAIAPDFKVSFSGGIAELTADIHQHPRAVEQLIARADAALYAAKRAGRNRIVLASDLPLEAQP